MPKPPYLFVTVGSTDFDALVQAVDRLMPSLGMDGIAQIGHGQYIPLNMPYFRFAPSLAPYYERASLVIAHGGLGITMEALSQRIPLVSVSNSDRYDDHQTDLLAVMAEQGYLVWCQRLDELKQAIETAQTVSLWRYQPPECEIHLIIHDFLKNRSISKKMRQVLQKAG